VSFSDTFLNKLSEPSLELTRIDILLLTNTAAESMHALPDIEVNIIEYSEAEHNTKNGIYREISSAVIADGFIVEKEKKNEDDIIKDDTEADAVTLTAAAAPSKKKKNAAEAIKEEKDALLDAVAGAGPIKKKKKVAETVPKEKGQMYYLVSCKDNGCGTSSFLIVVFMITNLIVVSFSVARAGKLRSLSALF
jgi:hypothetical protein